jgi:hypothetical protein
LLLRIAILFSALAPMCAAAQANAALSGPYRIAGTVVNAVTGEPVGGAMVEILTEEDNQTFASSETDGNGQFALEQLPAAKFELTASKRGYVTGFYDQHEDFNSAIVTGADQETGNLVFRLTPGAVLSGVVTDDGGDPVEGASVMLFKSPQGHEPDARIEQAKAEQTDDTGAYEFAGLEPGQYFLAVKASPWYALSHGSILPPGAEETQQQAALDVAYPVTYFDSTTDEASATPIVLTGGSREEADVNLHAVPALHVQVHAAQAPSGSWLAPAQMQQVIFGAAVEGDVDMVSIGHGETTEFTGLAPGAYLLEQGDSQRTMAMNLTASQQVDLSAGAAAVEVKGWLRSPGGAPVRGASVSLNPRGGTAGLIQVRESDEAGSFSFPAVPPGAWALQVTAGGMGGASVKPVIAVAAGGQTHAGDQITVADQPLNLMVTVGMQTARIEGFARKDGKGAGGAMVVLAPKDLGAMASLARRDESDSDGSFNLFNVAPGEYTVVAIADGWKLDWADPAVIGRYLPGGVSVTVKDEPGETAGAQGPRRLRLAQAVTVEEP